MASYTSQTAQNMPINHDEPEATSLDHASAYVVSGIHAPKYTDADSAMKPSTEAITIGQKNIQINGLGEPSVTSAGVKRPARRRPWLSKM